MGKVSCFRLGGVYCWFNSQEHRPPHFHAKRRGRWHVRVFFLRGKGGMMQRAGGPRERISAIDGNALCDMAELYRQELLREWEAKVRCDD